MQKVEIHCTSDGQKYKLRRRPNTNKELRNPRWYWIQACYLDGTTINTRKNSTWDGIQTFCDVLTGRDHEQLDVIFLIDGNVPESELNCVPAIAIWNRWEPRKFKEYGRQCVVVNPAEELRKRAIVTAAKL